MKTPNKFTNFKINNFLGIRIQEIKIFYFSRNIYVNYKTTLGG